MRTIRRVVSEGVALGNAQSQRLVDKLGNACLTFATELILAREREQGFIEPLEATALHIVQATIEGFIGAYQRSHLNLDPGLSLNQFHVPDSNLCPR